MMVDNSENTNSYIYNREDNLVVDNNRGKRGRKGRGGRQKIQDAANWTPSIQDLKNNKVPKDPVRRAIFDAAINDPKIMKLIEIQS
jgi:hypothetical protein